MTIRRKSFTAGKLGAAVGSIAAAMLLAASPARADLIQDTSVQVQGSGLGAVNTLLTVQQSSPTDAESGCVSSTGGASFRTGAPCLFGVEGGDEKTGGSQTLTRLVSNISSTEAGDLALVVNIAETGQDLTVTLTDLYLSLYRLDGTLAGSFSYTGPDLNLTQGTGTGLGGSGFVFVLDAAQAAQANAACPILTNCYAGGGVQFAAGSTNNGPDTVYIISVDNGVVQPPLEVPEPGALALFGAAGVLGALAARRRRTPSA